MNGSKSNILPAQKTHVLLVEDNEIIRKLVTHFVRDLSDIQTAADGEQGLSLARGYNFDLVLLDISLGNGKNGIEVLHELRKMPLYAKVPIIALTGHTFKNERDMLLSEGFTGYLSKPFKKGGLQQAVYVSKYLSRSFNHTRKYNLDALINICRERTLIDQGSKDGDMVYLVIGDLYLNIEHRQASALLASLLHYHTRPSAA